MRSSTLTLATSSALVLASPVAITTSSSPAKNNAQTTGTCRTYAPLVQALVAWGTPASSFCTYWQPINTQTVTTTTTSTSTVTAPTSTVTAATSTETITADAESVTLDQITITVDTSTSYSTVAGPTVTVTAAPAAHQCGNLKRSLAGYNKATSTTAKTSTTSKATSKTLPANCPKTIKTYPSAVIASACSCLHLPTPTSTVKVSSVPVVTSTPLATTTPLASTTITPTSTITPDPTTFTPVTTVTVTGTSTVTVPGVVLASPTAVTPVDASGNAQNNWDDEYFSIDLPFPISLYGTSSSTVQMSVNGHIDIGTSGTYRYTNYPLPASDIPSAAFLAYWSDLFIYQGSPQGLYYQVSGDEGSRTVAFEWYTSTYEDPTGYYHFIATFYEANPGAATYDYYQMLLRPPVTSTNGNTLGTVGTQQYSTNQFAQFSFNNMAPITSDMQIVYDPSSNTFSSSSCAA